MEEEARREAACIPPLPPGVRGLALYLIVAQGEEIKKGMGEGKVVRGRMGDAGEDGGMSVNRKGAESQYEAEGARALTCHRAGKLMKGLLTEAWNAKTGDCHPHLSLPSSLPHFYTTLRDLLQMLMWLWPLRAGRRTLLDDRPVDQVQTVTTTVLE